MHAAETSVKRPLDAGYNHTSSADAKHRAELKTLWMIILDILAAVNNKHNNEIVVISDARVPFYNSATPFT